MKNPIVEKDLSEIVADKLDWELLRGRRILVTGAAGFLPAYMVETILHLNEQRNFGCEVVGLVRNLHKANLRFEHFGGRKDLILIQADVSRPLPKLERCDMVIHAASQASPKFYGPDPVGTMTANVLGMHQLLELAREWKTERFLFFSSGEVYGRPDPLKIPTKETDYGWLDPLDPRSCYGEGKRAGETLAACYVHQFGVHCTVARPSHTYGPGLDLNDGRVFADFVRNVVEGQNIVLKSDGSAVRSFCYLSDATRAFFYILLRGVSGQAYNTGHPDGNISIRDLASLIVGLFPERRLAVEFQGKPTEAYVRSTVPVGFPDVSKLISLGWQPQTSVAKGFERTIRSFLKP